METGNSLLICPFFFILFRWGGVRQGFRFRLFRAHRWVFQSESLLHWDTAHCVFCQSGDRQAWVDSWVGRHYRSINHVQAWVVEYLAFQVDNAVIISSAHRTASHEMGCGGHVQ